MSQPWPWLLLAIVASAAWLSRPRRSVLDGGLTVTGGSVSIDASDPVETRAVWQWTGPSITGGTHWVRYWGEFGGQGVPEGAPIRLINGQFYDRSVAHEQPTPAWQWWTDAWGQPPPSNLGAQWPTYWRRVILTAQEQIVLNVVTVPETIRS